MILEIYEKEFKILLQTIKPFISGTLESITDYSNQGLSFRRTVFKKYFTEVTLVGSTGDSADAAVFEYLGCKEEPAIFFNMSTHGGRFLNDYYRIWGNLGC